MALINDLKKLVAKSRLFVQESKLGKERSKRKHGIKIGQGGTLDPLADGVLVIGIGKGTKALSQFLDCEKEYQTTCLLGCETDTYDSEGARVRIAPWRHVTQDEVQSTLSQFIGEIQQTPPIFSALKMDGKPLYEYARKGIPLPRPIEPRKVKVYSLELVEWKGGQHPYRWPTKTFNESEKKALERALIGVEKDGNIQDEIDLASDTGVPTAFVLKMRVSGGTYVRSIVHDLARALGSAGHVVTLTRSRQGRFALEATDDGDQACIPWEVFEKALVDIGEQDEDGFAGWERQVMERLELVEH